MEYLWGENAFLYVILYANNYRGKVSRGSYYFRLNIKCRLPEPHIYPIWVTWRELTFLLLFFNIFLRWAFLTNIRHHHASSPLSHPPWSGRTQHQCTITNPTHIVLSIESPTNTFLECPSPPWPTTDWAWQGAMSEPQRHLSIPSWCLHCTGISFETHYSNSYLCLCAHSGRAATTFCASAQGTGNQPFNMWSGTWSRCSESGGSKTGCPGSSCLRPGESGYEFSGWRLELQGMLFSPCNGTERGIELMLLSERNLCPNIKCRTQTGSWATILAMEPSRGAHSSCFPWGVFALPDWRLGDIW